MQDFIRIAYQALDDKKGHDILVLDIKNVSSLGDYFLIASGFSDNQVMAMADEVEEKLRLAGLNYVHMEGTENGSWILMDYGDFIIHIFKQEDRKFYDLERIWADAKDVTANYCD